MRFFILFIGCFTYLTTQAQEENIIYNQVLEVIEGARTIKDLEERVHLKVMTRMYEVRKKKIIEYYEAATGKFIGFYTDLEKVKINDIPYFQRQKGLKKLLRKYEDKEALKRYFESKDAMDT